MMAEIIELQIDTIPANTADLPEENARDIGPSQDRFAAVIAAIDAGDGALAERLMGERHREIEAHHRRVEAQGKRLRLHD